MELAVVLVITGLLSGLMLQVTQTRSGGVESECYAATKQQLEVIRQAIDQYVMANNRYPRPAVRTAGVEDPAFGREVSLANMAALDTTGTPPVTYGALPFQALNLAPSYAGDCWGNKFTYGVTTDLTDATKFMSPSPAYDGAIRVNSDATNTVLGNAAYAVISHGADGLGAVKTNYNGAGKNWCGTGSAVETKNCDAASTTVMAASFNDGKSAGSALFDDVVVFKAKPAIVPVNGVCNNAVQNGCTAGLIASADNATCGTAHWSCNGIRGGTSATNCSVALAACPVPVNGVCDTSYGNCTSGTAINQNNGCPGPSWSWTCKGSGGGTDAACTAPSACPVDGGWGAWSACSAPCGGGTQTRNCDSPAAANGGTPCPGPTSQACNTQACIPNYDGACGLSSGSCTQGSPTGLATGACGTSDSWSCTGSGTGHSTPCSMANAPCPITGACGNTTNTCTAGSPLNYVAGACGTTDTWTCHGANGGSDTSCSVPNAACPVTGQCGTTSNTCAAGNVVNFVAGTCGGASDAWTCQGTNGGSDTNCTVAAACVCGPMPGDQTGCFDGAGQNSFLTSYAINCKDAGGSMSWFKGAACGFAYGPSSPSAYYYTASCACNGGPSTPIAPPSCSPAAVANGSVNPSNCAISCNAGYTLNGASCTAVVCPIPSVSNGSVDPSTCAITCDAGYSLSGNSCVALACPPGRTHAPMCDQCMPVANGTTSGAPLCSITCNAGYTISGNSCVPAVQPGSWQVNTYGDTAQVYPTCETYSSIGAQPNWSCDGLVGIQCSEYAGPNGNISGNGPGWDDYTCMP